MSVFTRGFDLTQAIRAVKRDGFYLQRMALDRDTVSILTEEMDGLELEVGDHVRKPLQPGTPREVRQRHARGYFNIDDPEVPVASRVCRDLRNEVVSLEGEYPELDNWLLSEIGYQHYMGPTHWISPHRDRRSDNLLSVTVTLQGYAWMNFYRANTDPPNYKNLTRIKSVFTGPGTVMMLRAPGLGSGEQVIHEVMPPIKGGRKIVNLRMRRKKLLQPSKEGSLVGT